MDGFTRTISEEVRSLFKEGEVEVLVVRSRGPGHTGSDDSAVNVVHTSSGISVECGDYRSQAQNLITALIRLRIACDAGSI